MSNIERSWTIMACPKCGALVGDDHVPFCPMPGREAIEVVAAEQLRGAVDHMRESRIARARGLAQAIAECRDDARMDGIREGAAEIVQLLREQ